MAIAAVIAVALSVAMPGDAVATFGLDRVAERARQLAERPYREPPDLPAWLAELDYDAWRAIRFRPAEALWLERDLPFSVQFFHTGFLYDRAVRVHEVDGEGTRPVEFSADQFRYDTGLPPGRRDEKPGYAGLRVHFPIRTPNYRDEVIVFLGASYFRAVGRDQAYGLSARGLAVDTALPSGEEFPWFREFWLVRPTAGAESLTIYALMDSARLTGAYRFVVKPGDATEVDVRLRLFRRREVAKLGMAPLTSMFLFGENGSRTPADYRPEVHDSDGLLLALGSGEWLWRPLRNPRELSVSRFSADGLRGFGLLQRDREFDHYQDLEARPDRRPSTWITPQGRWGPGAVELVEIPSEKETNDNVVAYWLPDRVPEPGTPVELAYTLEWYGGPARRPPAGHVVATRHAPVEDRHRFVVDFAGEALTSLQDTAEVRGEVSTSGGDATILHSQVVRNPVTRGWRLTFQLDPKGRQATELRAFLRRGPDVLTETWSYRWAP